MESNFTSKTVILLENVDAGVPKPEHFKIVESQVLSANVPQGGILVQILVMSADPYLRGQIRTTGAIKAGSPMTGFVAGKVLHSENEKWKVNDLFGATLPFSTYMIIAPEMF
jgi:NADPH-dependent curcumin reductase CurA